ncbi:MAG: hypothetical protein EZS28_028527 [Streblomastix strix]|uniref:Uncharacterized protein n=1 Tax=Streblomastix strix TaxID=222440 RepID=A0A5J4UZ15_9EUKA|nr:MAG: hypothetical protein EZS28_028527 [Streblomastix strix]
MAQGQITININFSHRYHLGNITDILTTDTQPALPTGQSGIYQLFPNAQTGTVQINPVGDAQGVSYNQADGQTLTFQGKATQGNKQINPSTTGYDDGLRISRSEKYTGGSSFVLGCSRFSNTAAIAGQWQIFYTPSHYVNNPLGLTLTLEFDSSDTNRGLSISADGNTLSFNGQVIAGGSVNYSQGNTILWGSKSLRTDGGFYTDGTTVFWRDRALQFDPYYKNQ